MSRTALLLGLAAVLAGEALTGHAPSPLGGRFHKQPRPLRREGRIPQARLQAQALAKGEPLAALRGGGDDAAAAIVEYILALDVGTHATVASIKFPGASTATLVQNDMSHLETPTALSFRGKKIECGEIAADTPAMNAANQIAGYMPLLGPFRNELPPAFPLPIFKVAPSARSGCTSAEVTFNGGALEVPLEQAVAHQISTMQEYAHTQLKSHVDAGSTTFEGRSVALVVPSTFSDRQMHALTDAASISGYERSYLVPWHVAISQAYGERHKKDLLADNAAEGGGRCVCLVDVGASCAAATVVEFRGLEGKVLSVECTESAGAGCVDEILARHFEPEIDAQHGKGTCESPKSRFRLRKACERLKKMLSTLDETRINVDGLLPESEVSIKYSRAKLTDIELIADMGERIRRVVERAIAKAGIAPQDLSSLEVVGGGSRIPFVLAAVQSGGGGVAPSRTLDSSNALCLGAAVAAAWHAGSLKEGDSGVGVRVGGVIDGVKGGGMSADVLETYRQQYVKLLEVQHDLREQEAMTNQLEGYISEIRSSFQRKHGEKLAQKETNALLDETEEWIWAAPDGGYSTQEYRDRLHALNKAVQSLNPSFFEAVQAEADEAARRLEQESAVRRKEEEERKAAGEEDEDRDNRKLKFDDRLRMAESNKKEGNELHAHGNFAHAAERYLKALGHCSKMFDLTNDQKDTIKPLQEACHLNLALCWFKLGKMSKCIENCGDVLSINPQSAKAYVRRALAYENEKNFEDMLKDARSAIQVAAGREGEEAALKMAESLAVVAEKELQHQKKKQKQMYSKMFG